MPPEIPPAPFSPADFEVIEAAVMETERGRWFLAEFVRRNRSADTERVLDAIRRLASAIVPGHDRAAAPTPAPPTPGSRLDSAREAFGAIDRLSIEDRLRLHG